MKVTVIQIPEDSTVVEIRKMGQLRLNGLIANVCGREDATICP